MTHISTGSQPTGRAGPRLLSGMHKHHTCTNTAIHHTQFLVKATRVAHDTNNALMGGCSLV